ncbi:hypothetical protein [Dictyobacter kobayashii]|uniref:hypothetical protein n=1 Tax=Dictyobacter kobayashii TaxID=2014872 RepID=UPI0010A95115|nr:hypothetical protein [Dictyobacter kobayashii]
MSSYEQDSTREDDPDSLEELFSDNPMEQLQKTLQDLENAKILLKDILVIYLTQNPPNYQPEYRKYEDRTISVYKCRGLEVPVVIVLAGRCIDNDVMLSCAYSRATSRCIAIYDSLAFIDLPNSQFAAALMTEHPSIKQLQTTMAWPSLDKWHLTPIDVQGINLYWSDYWHGWVLLKFGEQVDPFLILWLLHILYTSFLPVYLGKDEQVKVLNPYHRMNKYSIEQLSKGIVYDDIPFLWCPSCKQWARVMKNAEDEWICLECSREMDLFFELPHFSSEMVQHYVQLALALAENKSLLPEPITPFSYSLHRWSLLNEKQREQLTRYCSWVDLNIPLCIARFLTGIEIITAQPGQQLENTYLQQHFWEQCPWLGENVDRTVWNQAVASCMGTWLTRRWVQKKEKGVYLTLHQKE